MSLNLSRLTQAALHISSTYLLRRQRRPFLASFKLTHRCNLRCQQCPFYSLPPDDSPLEKVVLTLDHLKQRGSRVIIFEGGEPLLWRDGIHTPVDIVQAARSRFLVTGMTTNGTLPLDIPADLLWVSLDGMEATHNRLRGADIFGRVMDNIARSPHPRLYAHITANNQNHREIPDLVRLLSGKVKGITVQFYYPYGGQDNLFLPFDEREKLISDLMRLKKAGFPILNSSAALNALRRNRWRCDDWLMDNANPDGSLSQGCYLRGRGPIDCVRCGFSPHTEISLAWQGSLPAVLAGLRIFF